MVPSFTRLINSLRSADCFARSGSSNCNLFLVAKPVRVSTIKNSKIKLQPNLNLISKRILTLPFYIV